MRKTMRILLLVLLIFVFLFSAGAVILQKIQDRENQQARQEAQQLVEHPSAVPSVSVPSAPQPAPAPQPVEEPVQEPEPEKPFLDEYVESLLQLDLTELQAVNEDVIGWIEIPGTPISYPILQGADNEYYLNHTWDKEYNAGGSIFMEAQNQPDFSNFNTLIYGHRMSDSSMFNSLRHYADKEYAGEHPYVYIVTGQGVRIYQVFAAMKVTVTDPVYWLITDQEKYKAPMIEFCLTNSEIASELIPSEEDAFLTLSTCTGLTASDDRWVVVAVELGVVSK